MRRGQPQGGRRQALTLLHLLEGPSEGLGGGRPVGGVLGQALLGEVGERRRDPVEPRGGRLQHAGDGRGDRLVGLAGEGRRAGDQRVERGRQAVHVGALVRALPLENLGGDVGHGERSVARGGPGPALDGGDAEVAELHLAERPDEQVLGLQVPVENPRGVSGAERPGHLDADVDGLEPGERPRARATVGEGAGVEQLHGQPRVPVGHAGVEDGDHVGVPRQVAHDPALPLEAAPGPLVHAARGQDL